MAIKKTEILSRADFGEAVVTLRLNVSEIAKETGIPRTYLSEFRNGDRKLRPEHQAKLRDYFEAHGVVFEDSKEPDTENGAAPAAPIGKVHGGALPFPAPAFHCPVAADLKPEHVKAISARLEAVTRRIAELLPKPLAYDSGVLIRSDEPTEESHAEHAALVGLLAEEAILRRRLEGRDIAPPLTPRLAEAGTLLNTHAEWLARDYPHPAIPNGMIPAAEGGEDENEDQDGGRDKTPGQPATKPKSNESIWDQLYGSK